MQAKQICGRASNTDDIHPDPILHQCQLIFFFLTFPIPLKIQTCPAAAPSFLLCGRDLIGISFPTGPQAFAGPLRALSTPPPIAGSLLRAQGSSGGRCVKRVDLSEGKGATQQKKNHGAKTGNEGRRLIDLGVLYTHPSRQNAHAAAFL